MERERPARETIGRALAGRSWSGERSGWAILGAVPAVRIPLRLFFPLIVAPMAVMGTLAFGPDPLILEPDVLVERRPEDRGAPHCGTCHPDQHASWQGTYHRTMTQLPGPRSVRGEFDGVLREGVDGPWAPLRRGDAFLMSFPDREAEIALVVGSHVYQQYFERIDSSELATYRRLPFLWHIEERAWMPVGRVFFDPGDGVPGRHAAIWNENCIFCHNTRPRPRMRTTEAEGGEAYRSFDSRVSELGIACEACHGPGRRHVERYANTLLRYVAQFEDSDDPTIVHPEKLSQEREVSLCGQCHAQRLPNPHERIFEFMAGGPTFRPGDLLGDHVEPLRIDTPSVDPGDPELFRKRFWSEGTPRLTAYEYQGVTTSPCFEAGALRCDSCHRMHRGDSGREVDPRAQIDPDLKGDRACTRCHAGMVDASERHTGHAPDSPGSRCVACHMPRIVYGLLGIRRSHRIESPDPRRDIEAGRPNACTLCHLDRDGGWVAREMTRIFGRPFEAPRRRPDRAPLDVPEALASLLCGDVLQRAVAAQHFGAPEVALESSAKAWLVAHLIVTLGDGYPAIRHLARRSLVALDEELELGLASGLADEGLFGDPERRREVISELLTRLAGHRDRFDVPPPATLLGSDLRLDLDRVQALLELQSSSPISIGE